MNKKWKTKFLTIFQSVLYFKDLFYFFLFFTVVIQLLGIECGRAVSCKVSYYSQPVRLIQEVHCMCTVTSVAFELVSLVTSLLFVFLCRNGDQYSLIRKKKKKKKQNPQKTRKPKNTNKKESNIYLLFFKTVNIYILKGIKARNQFYLFITNMELSC